MQLYSNLLKPKVQQTQRPSIVIFEVGEQAVEQNMNVEVGREKLWKQRSQDLEFRTFKVN